ncbi:hypothetical protein CsSME_00050671 [Camellia sinensis var. sinensis]
MPPEEVSSLTRKKRLNLAVSACSKVKNPDCHRRRCTNHC